MGTGEAGVGGVLVQGAGPHRHQTQLVAHPVELGDRRGIRLHDGLDHVGRQRVPGRHRQPAADRGAELGRLAAEDVAVDGLGQRRDAAPPSGHTRDSSPGAEDVDLAGRAVHPDAGAVGDHGGRVTGADDAGDPYSRATIAAWLSCPPRSVTIAPSSGSTTLKYGEVLRVTSTSPCLIRPKSAELSTSSGGALVRPAVDRHAAHDGVGVLLLRHAEQVQQHRVHGTGAAARAGGQDVDGWWGRGHRGQERRRVREVLVVRHS